MLLGVTRTRPFRLAAWFILGAGVLLAMKIAGSPFYREGEVTLELHAGRDSMLTVLRDFVSVFSVLLAFQTAALFGWSLALPREMSRLSVRYAVCSVLIFFWSLFWTLYTLVAAMVGGHQVLTWQPWALMVLLTVGTALMLFLIDEVVEGAKARDRRSES